MMTEFQQRKLINMFNLYDSDQDGYLEAFDFELPAQRILARLGHTSAAAESAKWWPAFWQGIAHLADDQGRVTQAAWLAYLDGLWNDPATFEATIQAGASFYVAAVDHDGDGKLNATEYSHLLHALGMDDGAIDEVFPLLDADHDGYLTREETATRVREFYGDDHDAPGNWLLGKF